jgi:hypothetical protein
LDLWSATAGGDTRPETLLLHHVLGAAKAAKPYVEQLVTASFYEKAVDERLEWLLGELEREKRAGRGAGVGLGNRGGPTDDEVEKVRGIPAMYADAARDAKNKPEYALLANSLRQRDATTSP